MIGDKIKEVRKRAGITQQELANRLETTPQNLSQYENGKRHPKLSTIRKIAEALEVPLADLVDDWSTFSKDEITDDWNNSKISVSNDEKILIQDYHKLNDNGQNEARKRINELTKIPEYQKKEED